MNPDQPHALYRLFDAESGLLYIGITWDLTSRLNQHAKDKPWWSDVRAITIEHHPDRLLALAAEKIAIQREQPRHNITHQEHIWRSRMTPELLENAAAELLMDLAVSFHSQGMWDSLFILRHWLGLGCIPEITKAPDLAMQRVCRAGLARIAAVIHDDWYKPGPSAVARSEP